MPHRNKDFPHLLPLDIELWQRFLKANPRRFESYHYDTRVGDGRDPGDSTPNNIRQMSIDLSQRRIDAIGYTDTDLTIIEIAVSAGIRAIGQLIVYPILYQQKYRPTSPVKILLVAAEIQTDIEQVLIHRNIPFEVYP